MSDRTELEELRRLDELERKAKLAKEMDFASQGAMSRDAFKEKALDVAKAIPSGLAQGTISLGQLGMMPGYIAEKAVNWAAEQAGGPEETFSAMSGMMKPYEAAQEMVNYAPQTTPGRYAKSIAENVPAAAMGPGTIPLKAAGAIGAGSGAELADSLVSSGNPNEGGNPLARAGGAMLGGMVPWTIAGRVSNANQLLHESLQHTTPGDFRRAERLAAELAANRMPSHLNSQLLNNSTFDDLVQMSAGYPGARPLVEGRLAGAPKEAGEAMGAWLDRNLPPQVASRREMLGDVQELAAGKIEAGKRLANQRYTANMPQPMPATPGMVQARADYPVKDMMTMHKELLDLANSPKFVNSEGAKVIRKFVQEKLTQPDGMPVTNRWALNNAYKDLNALKQQEGWKGMPDAALRTVLDKYTPDFQAARAAKAETMRKVVEPMQKGLTGDLARMGGGIKPDRYTALETAFNRVFTADRNQAKEIREFAKQIGDDEFSQFFGEYLRKEMAKTLNRGSTAQSPYKFTLDIARTPQQIANLNASLEVVARSMGAKPQEVTKGFSNLMRAFETYKKTVLAGGLAQAPTGWKAGLSALGLAVAPMSRAGRATTEYVSAKTFQQIVNLALDPKGLAKLEQLARVKPTSSRMRAFLDGLTQTSVQMLSAEEPRKSPMLDDVTKGAQ